MSPALHGDLPMRRSWHHKWSLALAAFAFGGVLANVELNRATGSRVQTEGKKLSADSIEEFKKLGGEFADYESNVPFFRFKNLPKAKLPTTKSPFGLDLQMAKVTPAELRELALIPEV